MSVDDYCAATGELSGCSEVGKESCNGWGGKALWDPGQHSQGLTLSLSSTSEPPEHPQGWSPHLCHCLGTTSRAETSPETPNPQNLHWGSCPGEDKVPRAPRGSERSQGGLEGRKEDRSALVCQSRAHTLHGHIWWAFPAEPLGCGTPAQNQKNPKALEVRGKRTKLGESCGLTSDPELGKNILQPQRPAGTAPAQGDTAVTHSRGCAGQEFQLWEPPLQNLLLLLPAVLSGAVGVAGLHNLL